jgi:hypothetical protein
VVFFLRFCKSFEAQPVSASGPTSLGVDAGGHVLNILEVNTGKMLTKGSTTYYPAPNQLKYVFQLAPPSPLSFTDLLGSFSSS